MEIRKETFTLLLNQKLKLESEFFKLEKGVEKSWQPDEMIIKIPWIHHRRGIFSLFERLQRRQGAISFTHETVGSITCLFPSAEP